MRARWLPAWPRRLRWRLVLGFALSVALLQIGLAGAERVLLEQVLMRSLQDSLETTVRAGLAGQALAGNSPAASMTLWLKQVSAEWASRPAVPAAPEGFKDVTPAGGYASPQKEAVRKAIRPAGDYALLKRDLVILAQSEDTAKRLPALAAALALPDQPVALLDGHGNLLQPGPTPAGPIPHRQPLATDVLAVLTAVARQHVAHLSHEWVGRVSAPDGPYLVVLWPTSETMLTQQEADAVLLAGKAGPKALAIPGLANTLAGVHPSPVVVAIGRRLGGIQQTLDTVTAIGAGGSLAAIVLAALLGLLVVGRALRPLAAVMRGAERLAEGDYAYRVDLDAGGDEIGRLVGAFDRMAAAIATAFATQRRFVADASHELRTPLTALQGYTDVLLVGAAEDPATTERVLRAMQEDVGRMSRLVEDLLTLARLDGGSGLRPSRVALDDLLGAAAAEGRVITQAGQQIVVEPVPGNLDIWGDRDRLRQVLSNLIGNSCAYCPAGSTIALRAARREGWAVVELRDNGPGIPPRDLARLGERFYRGDAARSRRTGGAGLGLAIARAIVEAHGGTLSIASTLGQGTTTTLHLPLVPPALPPHPCQGASVPSAGA